MLKKKKKKKKKKISLYKLKKIIKRIYNNKNIIKKIQLLIIY